MSTSQITMEVKLQLPTDLNDLSLIIQRDITKRNRSKIAFNKYYIIKSVMGFWGFGVLGFWGSGVLGFWGSAFSSFQPQGVKTAGGLTFSSPRA